MSLHRGGETFADLGGLEALKAFYSRSLARRASNPLSRPRGVLLLGVSGTGKSAFCKALGNEVGRPTLILDIGALMGSLVGLTDERTCQALRIADAMAPCIVSCDEIEKGSPASRPAARLTAASRPGCSARCSRTSTTTTATSTSSARPTTSPNCSGVHQSREVRFNLLP
jgi:hypothetical protein